MCVKLAMNLLCSPACQRHKEEASPQESQDYGRPLPRSAEAAKKCKELGTSFSNFTVGKHAQIKKDHLLRHFKECAFHKNAVAWAAKQGLRRTEAATEGEEKGTPSFHTGGPNESLPPPPTTYIHIYIYI